MELVDRYVHEVGQYLPSRLRADVEAELRSLLTESVEERARAAGCPADAQLAADVVREFGVPRDVALRYAPEPQYLIGPRLYPAYRMAVKIMIPVLAGVVLVLMVIGQFRHQGEPPSIAPLIRATGSFLSTVLFNLGVMTFVFALVERAIRQREAAGTVWDPATLPPVNDPDRISYFGRIFVLYLIAALALLFNFFPEWVAVVVFNNADSRVYPLLEPAFSRYLPLLNAWWALAFALNLVVLRQGRWRRTSRRADFALEVFNGVILLVIVAGPPVFHYDMWVKLVLQIFLVVSVIKACAMLYRLLVRKAAEPWAQRG
jgi:hypothetical protein